MQLNYSFLLYLFYFLFDLFLLCLLWLCCKHFLIFKSKSDIESPAASTVEIHIFSKITKFDF